MKRVKKVVLGMMMLGMAGMAFAQSPQEPLEEVITIETFFPAPWAEFDEMRLYPTTREAGYCDNDRIGYMYYDDNGTGATQYDDAVKVCKGTELGWQKLGGLWTASGNDIYNSNAGNVGIGTAFPQTALDVNGAIKLAINEIEPFSCNVDHDGALSLSSLYRMCVCKNGTGWVFASNGVSACSWTVLAATGGSVTFDGDYKIHTFIGPGTFNVTTGGTASALLVGGGGGGGRGGEGGAGAGGGIIEITDRVFTVGNYDVQIGQGGAGATSDATNGVAGGNTTFDGETATGGGYGSGALVNGGNGANGGGGRDSKLGGTGSAPTPVGADASAQGGNNGGNSAGGAGGGGGGAGGVGGNGTSTTTGGNGAQGYQSNIDGNNYFYAAGGGGAGHAVLGTGGNGGAGGGGGGVGSTPGTGGGSARNSGGTGGAKGGDGGANTGSGGGGGGSGGGGKSAGSGASGIVIIRYKYQ